VLQIDVSIHLGEDDTVSACYDGHKRQIVIDYGDVEIYLSRAQALDLTTTVLEVLQKLDAEASK